MTYKKMRIHLLVGAMAATSWTTAVNAQNAVANEEGVGFDEIIVTAQKRAESLQGTPISIAAATGEQLQDRSVVTIGDLQQTMPTLNIMFAPLSPGSINAAMRGNVVLDIRLNVDPVVGVYLDGVYLPRNQGLDTGTLFDIERIEVLAGPQSTLYGKSTSGGAINILTKKASTERFEGTVRASIAQHLDRQLSAMVNAPLSDNLAARLVSTLRERRGLGTNAFNGERLGKISSSSGRLSMLWKPTDRVTVNFNGDYSNSSSTNIAYKGFLFISPTSPALAATARSRGITTAQALTYLQSFSRGNADDGSLDLPGHGDEYESWGTALTVDAELNDDVSLRSISAYRGFKREGAVDLDGTPEALLQYPQQDAFDEQLSQELQLSGESLSDRLKWIAGLFYSTEKGYEHAQQIALAALTGGIPTIQVSDNIKTKSFGVFTQGTFKFTDKIAVTAGIRYSEDKKSLEQKNRQGANCLSLGLPLATTTLAGCVRPMSRSFDQITYTIGAEFRPLADDDLLIYAKNSKGYRAGGLQQTSGATTVTAADIANASFDSETVQSYELGLKSIWFDRRLIFNLALFRAEVSNQIRSVARPLPGSAAVAQAYQNAASSHVNGAEYTISAFPVPWLQLDYSGTYMKASYDEYITPSGEDRSALPLSFTPKWRHSISGTVRIPTSIGELQAHVDYLYTSRQLATEPGAYVPSYQIVNARTSMKLDEPNVEIALFARNVFDKRFYQFPTDLPLGFATRGTANPPRTVGVELEAHF